MYRVRQVWVAVRGQPRPQDLELARSVLSPAQMALFLRMQPGEQLHSLAVLRRLEAQGMRQPDLLAAALLHDVGKSRLPLRLWERAWIVLVGALLPGSLARWGDRPYHEGQRLPAWQRPLVVACQHPEWGARMAEEAGASPLVISLIRRHQQKIPPDNNSQENRLLSMLQAVDDQN
jgi:hypothetical protein